ncbi:IS5 family transposase [Haloarchaeobius iranensis]
MQKVLFRFVKQAVSIARKLTDAALMQISHPAGNGVAGWKHAVLHFLRLHMDATLQEVLDWAEEMERVRAALVLERGEFPGPSALCKSFDRAPMRIWRELLRLSSELLDQSGHAAIDATYFDRRQASNHYLKRCEREVQTVQATFLVDTAQGAVIDVHCSAKWPNGTNVGPQVALRNAGDLRSLAADKGYDDMGFREELRAEGVRPLIKHRVFAPYDHAHNARIDDDLYNQRSVCETVNSVIKRSYGSAVRARAWYRQFREIVLAAAVYNVEQAVKQ